jgi:hypothetical protein
MKYFSSAVLTALTLSGTLCVALPAAAQIAGQTTTVDTSVIEST